PRGDDRTADVPLDSVDPATASLGLAYDAATWGAELAARFAARKDRVSDPELYRTPGYGVLDLYGHWDFAPGLQLHAGVRNIADRKDGAAGDLPRALATTRPRHRFPPPGRSLAVSLSVEF